MFHTSCKAGEPNFFERIGRNKTGSVINPLKFNTLNVILFKI